MAQARQANRRWWIYGTMSAVLAFMSAGCYKATGGGWIQSANGSVNASFGFSVMCNTFTQNDGTPAAELYGGQLEWHDGPVAFHGDVESFDIAVIHGVRCQDVRATLASRGGPMQFGGTYRPQNGGAAGTFFATVIDNGSPTATGDFVQIDLFDGEYGGYANAGTLQGGNIQVF